MAHKILYANQKLPEQKIQTTTWSNTEKAILTLNIHWYTNPNTTTIYQHKNTPKQTLTTSDTPPSETKQNSENL